MKGYFYGAGCVIQITQLGYLNRQKCEKYDARNGVFHSITYIFLIFQFSDRSDRCFFFQAPNAHATQEKSECPAPPHLRVCPIRPHGHVSKGLMIKIVI